MTPGFRIAAAYAFAERNGLAEDAARIRTMQIHPSIAKPSVVRKGALVELFEARGLIDDFVAQHWPARHTPAGDKRRTVFRQRKDLNERRLRGEEVPETPDEPPEPEERTLFALEAHLRDFIAGNLAMIPIGSKQLALFKDAKGRSGVEYPTDVGRIDILTIDSDGNYYVFELKVQLGPDRALGQLARYMGWVKIEIAGNKKVAGVIVANSIDPKLRYAASVLPDVFLLEYELDFKIHGVEPMLQQTVSPQLGA